MLVFRQVILCRLLANYGTFFHTFFSDSTEIQKLKKCYLEGITYSLYEEMSPDIDTCYVCFCTEDFNNATAVPMNPNCRKIDCLYELHRFNSLRQGCVPLFFKNRCCAIGFRCRKCFGITYIFHPTQMNSEFLQQKKVMKSIQNQY